MKRFLLRIFGFALVTVTLMVALDFVYTQIFATSPPRSKFELFRTLKGGKTGYVFLGSSRVDNDIVPEIIEEKTGLTTYNLGFQASKIADILTMVRLIKAYDIQTEKLFIQIDYNYNLDGRSNLMPFEVMPFARDNEITRDYVMDLKDGYGLYYLPFYRYCAYDQKIGLREILMHLSGRTGKVIPSKGFSPIYGQSYDPTYALPENIREKNPTFEKLNQYVRAQQLQATYFCAPFDTRSRNLDFTSKLKMKIPGLVDYSQALKNASYFQNNAHLNESGARRFSEILADDILKMQ